ncbi:MAG: hypothetical protein H0T75_01635 [Rhizobiales bacterium]|nr:hypothetical protein [Hyphomicrobiales bacterium]
MLAVSVTSSLLFGHSQAENGAPDADLTKAAPELQFQEADGAGADHSRLG